MNNKYVIVRADRAGVFFGILKEKNGQEVTMTYVRKLHYWNGAAAVEQLALNGTSNPNDCRFTVSVPEMTIDGVIQVIPCSKQSIDSLKSVKEWKH